jgi:hypothetical protein
VIYDHKSKPHIHGDAIAEGPLFTLVDCSCCRDRPDLGAEEGQMPGMLVLGHVERELRQRDTASIAGRLVSDKRVGTTPLWVTSNSGVPSPPADTPPNAAFIDDPAVVSDKRLDSFPFSFFERCCAQLTFRHNFNLEASDVDPNIGFDGGLLEMSTDGGNTFQDILAVGGSFVSGGYNRTIATDRGSPIAGRQAWSGNSGGFITTVVNLPTIQTVGRLRWRMASDTSGSGEGWRVDTIRITWCGGVGTPCPDRRPTPAPRP